jgi:hypothetical protein
VDADDRSDFIQLREGARALRLISAHKNIQHEARYAELLQGRIKVSVIGM